VVGLAEVLEIYQPEIVRYLFAGTKPNSEFAISFDLDVLKIYEDYDKCERIYFGEQEVGEKKREKESRIYELSQVSGVPETMPLQIPFRHLCNLLQIHSGDVEAVLDQFDLDDEQRRRLRVRAQCGWNWITRFAPEDFRFRLQSAEDPQAELSEAEAAAMRGLLEVVERLDAYDEKSLGQAIYDVAREAGIEPKELFGAAYRVLIGKEKGPRLAGFIVTVGKERVAEILRRYA
jgi:lysyl-tRNA synthetase class 1